MKNLTFSNLILSTASLTRIKQLSGKKTSSMYSETFKTYPKGYAYNRQQNRWKLFDSLFYTLGTCLLQTSPSKVFSIRPLTALASSEFLSFISCAEMIGVLIDREAFMISFIRGTPRVMSDTIKND